MAEEKPNLKDLEYLLEDDISEESEDSLAHYGTPRHSGRYPWGSGKNPQRSRSWLNTYRDLKAKGLSETDIAKSMHLKNTSELRARRAIYSEEEQQANYAFAYKLKQKGMSNQAIAERMGHSNESYVRTLLKSGGKTKENSIKTVANVLAEQAKEKGMIDIGKNVNLTLQVTENKLSDAVEYLKYSEGYNVIYPKAQQLGTGFNTTFKVLVPPGMYVSEAYKSLKGEGISNIKAIDGVVCPNNGHEEVRKVRPPVQIDSKRIMIRYAEDGGKDKDGVIEVNPEAKDLDLGKNRYAQVRIGVDGTHYLKGMAVRGYNMPEGVDIIFNTNKHEGTPMTEVLKEQKPDKYKKNNPFGAEIKPQTNYIGDDGKEHQSALNMVNEEGQWDTWSKSLASQFLSKQSLQLAKRQLNIAAEIKEDQFEDIMSLTNGTLKKQLLKEFGDECDSAAVHLRAAAMPRQSTKVILPVPSLKPNEVYAPTYENGEEVILVRYPHEGTFQIPRLIVNNNNREGKRVITGQATDAIGIHPSAAEKLSGADFDGDSVLVIPTKGQNLKSDPVLKGLENFDAKEAYPGKTDTAPWKKGSLQEHIQMGKISNLITDMTLRHAAPEELARAVRHANTIIDTGKHNLDYKASYYDNGIAELTQKYQGDYNPDGKTGASSLISKAKAIEYVSYRNPNRPYEIDPETGKKIFMTSRRAADRFYYNKKTGKREERQTHSTKMYEAQDARELSAGHPMEEAYADYANRMKALGDRARKAMFTVKDIEYNPSAAKEYSDAVESIKSKLLEMDKNAPRERQAVAISNAKYRAKLQANPDLTKDEIKKIKNYELKEARELVGSKRGQMEFTDREWEAIQAGAVRKTTVSKAFAVADQDKLKQRAMPRTKTGMSPAKLARAKALMKNANYTLADIAEALDVSMSTLQANLKEE